MVSTNLLLNSYVKFVIALLVIVIAITLYSDLIPDLQQAGDDIEDTNVPLGSLFSGQTGVVFTIVMLFLLILILRGMLVGRGF